MSLKTYQTWSAQTDQMPFTLLRAKGGILHSQEFGDLLDMSSLSFQASFGHQHPKFLSAIEKQMKDFAMAPPKAGYAVKEEVSNSIEKLLGLSGGKLFYTVSGAEAVENALKMARQFTGRKVIMAQKASYHGATLGALSVTGDWRNDPHATVDEWTLRIPNVEDDPDFSKTRKLAEEFGPEKLAGLVIESISGVNGVVAPSQKWWDEARKFTRDHGLKLICDEVLCGFYRTGPAFGFQKFSLTPDLICLSKAISGGYIPFGAVWTDRDISEFYKKEVLSCGLTNYAHPLGLATCQAACDLLTDSSFLKHREKIEKIFLEKVREISGLKSVVDTRAHGLLGYIQFEKPELKFEDFLKAGIFTILKPTALVLAPPFILSENEMEEGMEKIKELLS